MGCYRIERGFFELFREKEIQPPGVVARLVTCRHARAVTLQGIGV